MNSRIIRFAILLVCITITKVYVVKAEDTLLYRNWQNADPKKDKKMGVSVEKAYKKLLAGKESEKVIVAVIDGGIDLQHEDLQGALWVNKGEIPGNGIDDDNNGYIDDVNGWNFIGNSDGENIQGARLELTRLYRQYRDRYEGLDEDSLRNIGDEGYDRYITLKGKFEDKRWSFKWKLNSAKALEEYFLQHDSIIRVHKELETYSLEDLLDLEVGNDTLLDSARTVLISLLETEFSLEDIGEDIKAYKDRLNNHYNPDFDDRAIIGDDPNEWTEKVYGNNDAEGEDPAHGTMVAGIIGAIRNNKLGVDGIADNVEIMSIRTIPDGDEWDKDVARAILYAIENGAQVINMSFGKGYSPQKNFVDGIVRMADENNVLLVHAAGNDGKNIDDEDNFPNKYSENADILANNWITVGASRISAKNKELVADFSNYGKSTVDVFAPGDDMLLCVPDNEYEIASGTSFAAPVVSGVAALLLSYYPELTAPQVKEIILNSSVKKDYEVITPNTRGKDYEETIMFSTLSVSGGLVNAYEAILLAEKITKK